MMRKAIFSILIGLIFLAGCSTIATTMLNREVQLDAASASLTQGVDALQKGDIEAADRLLHQAIALFGPTQGYSTVAQRLMEHGKPEKAVEILEEGTKQYPSPLLYGMLGEAAQKCGDTQKAKKSGLEAEARASKQLEAITGHTNKQEGSDKAQVTQDLLSLGQYYSEIRHDLPAALRAYREALRLDPANPILQNALGYTLADKGTTKKEWQEAVLHTKAAVTALPSEGIVLDSYGWALYKTGDIPGANRVLQEAVDLASDIAEVHYHLACVYLKEKNTERARLELQRAQRLRPEYPEAEAALKSLPSPVAPPEKAVANPPADPAQASPRL